MQQIPINWWAVIVAAIIRMVVGSVWFSPVGFMKPWQRLSGISEAQVKASFGRAIGVDAVMSLIMAFILFHAVVYAGAMNLWAGAVVGFLNWLGFIFTVFVGLWAYEQKPIKLVSITAGFNLVALILMGALIGVWH
jgi:Protein of unknown function (DUF1761)